MMRSMSPRGRKTAMHETKDDEQRCSVVKGKSKRRWRLAFTAISFTRAITYLLSKKALRRNAALLRRSLSYVSIDVGSSSSFLDLDPKALGDAVKAKSVKSFTDRFGGVKKLAEALETDLKLGICANSDAEFARRRQAFGANEYRKPRGRSFLSFVAEAFKDTVILILLGCAVLSLGFGIKQHGIKEGWFDGGSIILAVFLVVVVSAASNFRQSRQFRKLAAESGDIKVEVARGGRRIPVSIFEVVVGDVVWLKIGDQVPADGVFVEGHSLKVDESRMTGESDHVEVDGDRNPFLLSGTKVSDGFGSMLVAAVGMNTAWGEMMSSVSCELDETTPLQARLEKLTSFIAKIGLSVAALVLVIMMIRYFTGHTVDESGRREFVPGTTRSSDVTNSVIGIVTAAVAIVVVAIPEGLPLAVTLALAYSMKRMMKDNAMVRKLSACETMGSATTICTDKTGTLTLNEMKVTEVRVGGCEETLMADQNSAVSKNVSQVVLRLLREAVALNTTGSVYKPSPEGVAEVSGSPTEKAILSWAVFGLGLDIDEVKQECETLLVEAFNSEKKRSGVLIQRRTDTRNVVEAHWKGAAEMVLEMCSSFHDGDGNLRDMDDEQRTTIETVINNMAAKSLRCIAFAHKEIASQNGPTKLAESGLTFLGLVGLKDPCRPGVRAAVEACAAAGVTVKMITGDNPNTARAIALECGILAPAEAADPAAVMEGSKFRSLSPEERSARADRIRVMARSSPLDKLLMVQCLKDSGHVVAVTGDGTNDAPALKAADIGLSMGVQGTEVAKESSDIVILDDNFASVVTVLRWGRCVHGNIQKFIQFQLTVNAAALVVNFLAAVTSGRVPLTAVQLLWVNLIMDTLAALALATEPPTDRLMADRPVGRAGQLVTPVMWRNLVAQALFQITVLLALEFRGKSIFGVDEKVNDTMIFNTFVLCQVFNEFNARRLTEKNIFRGVHRNKLFLGIIGFTIVLQVVMVEFLKKFAKTVRLDWAEWAACIGIAALSWPIAWLVKWIPVPEKQA